MSDLNLNIRLEFLDDTKEHVSADGTLAPSLSQIIYTFGSKADPVFQENGLTWTLVVSGDMVKSYSNRGVQVDSMMRGANVVAARCFRTDDPKHFEVVCNWELFEYSTDPEIPLFAHTAIHEATHAQLISQGIDWEHVAQELSTYLEPSNLRERYLSYIVYAALEEYMCEALAGKREGSIPSGKLENLEESTLTFQDALGDSADLYLQNPQRAFDLLLSAISDYLKACFYGAAQMRINDNISPTGIAYVANWDYVNQLLLAASPFLDQVPLDEELNLEIVTAVTAALALVIANWLENVVGIRIELTEDGAVSCYWLLHPTEYRKRRHLKINTGHVQKN